MFESNTTHEISQYIHQRYRQLYHVTSRYRADLIAARGIDPSRSKGKRKVSWYVEWQMLGWAIAHVSLRHGTPLNNIVVIGCAPLKTELSKTAWKHVYTLNRTFYPDPRHFSSARRSLKQLMDEDAIPF